MGWGCLRTTHRAAAELLLQAPADGTVAGVKPHDGIVQVLPSVPIPHLMRRRCLLDRNASLQDGKLVDAEAEQDDSSASAGRQSMPPRWRTSVVSRWFVMPTALTVTSTPCRLAPSNAPAMQSVTLCQISSGSCSVHLC